MMLFVALYLVLLPAGVPAPIASFFAEVEGDFLCVNEAGEWTYQAKRASDDELRVHLQGRSQGNVFYEERSAFTFDPQHDLFAEMTTNSRGDKMQGYGKMEQGGEAGCNVTLRGEMRDKTQYLREFWRMGRRDYFFYTLWQAHSGEPLESIFSINCQRR